MEKPMRPEEPEEDRGKVAPSTFASISIFVAGLMVTGFVSLVYSPIKNDISELKREVYEMKTDPSPKPETRVELRAMTTLIDHLEARVARLEDRMSNVHMFLNQFIPGAQPARPPFVRRGDIFPPLDPQQPQQPQQQTKAN
jgi:hypothetical protein